MTYISGQVHLQAFMGFEPGLFPQSYWCGGLA